ncbi:DNA-3-methyladenine glycosylase [Luteimonas sp. RD2P54]|uniref:Putative 3-methyladenine DNA glycosylase n=1 Tax=Luteimonas endophytica TaxID=3042023 RepID=A0ABT6J7P5_9GAMM|nr:DNA-3-methyladenine glycosylase [Luteimonas endophytica]MDH5822855.1 DNA-3-methyladenine glycosylase [Luteimonas endophytica]
MAESGRALPRAFFDRDVLEVAPDLVHRVFAVADGRAGRIVEVEAYRGADDPAAHSFRGRTARNATMFGPPGHLYVYLSYGLHWCCNATCGNGTGVLIRAVRPLAGIGKMREARGRPRREADLANGPGKVGQAFGIDRGHDGEDLVAGERVAILDDGHHDARPLLVTPRIGISKAADFPWRWVAAPH